MSFGRKIRVQIKQVCDENKKSIEKYLKEGINIEMKDISKNKLFEDKDKQIMKIE